MARTGGFLPLSFLFISALLIHVSSAGSGVGVNYGTLGNNLPPPTQVANFLKQRTIIDRVKLFDANPDYIKAFANTGIAVTVTVANGDIPSLTDLATARNWVNTHIAPFHPQTNINRIAVGNEILHSLDDSLISKLVLAMQTLHTALTQAGINNVQVSTPHSLGILNPFVEPSTATFRAGWDVGVLAPMLQFLRKTKSVFMVNPYPYFGYDPNNLNFAIFKRNSGLYDRFARKTYTNMFDVQLDAIYSAMKKLGYGDVNIVAAETGWPSMADNGQLGVSVQSAASYNGGVVRHTLSGRGTPLMPFRKIETYIFGLFNENLKPGPTAERNFGLFQPDFTPVYNAGVMIGQQKRGGGHHPHRGGQPHPAPRGRGRGRGRRGKNPRPAVPAGGKKWCLPKADATEAALQKNLDWVCSLGKVDCKPINAGGSCVNPNTVRAHAAYAMNAYYQITPKNSVDCDFAGTAILTSNDPSYGVCHYPA